MSHENPSSIRSGTKHELRNGDIISIGAVWHYPADNLVIKYKSSTPQPVNWEDLTESSVWNLDGKHGYGNSQWDLIKQVDVAPVSLASADCFHTPVNTGTRKSWCAKCNIDMHWDGGRFISLR